MKNNARRKEVSTKVQCGSIFWSVLVAWPLFSWNLYISGIPLFLQLCFFSSVVHVLSRWSIFQQDMCTCACAVCLCICQCGVYCGMSIFCWYVCCEFDPSVGMRWRTRQGGKNFGLRYSVVVSSSVLLPWPLFHWNLYTSIILVFI